jgi:hypothetical protein
MSVYSIALPRCPVFFKRRKYSKVAFKLSAPDDLLPVPYPSADVEAVTHITAPCAFLCVCRIGHSL